MILAGVDCENCRYGDILEESKARIKVYCSIKDKFFWWGQCIPCELKSKKEDEKDENH